MGGLGRARPGASAGEVRQRRRGRAPAGWRLLPPAGGGTGVSPRPARKKKRKPRVLRSTQSKRRASERGPRRQIYSEVFLEYYSLRLEI
jgi:hypothetical protein